VLPKLLFEAQKTLTHDPNKVLINCRILKLCIPVYILVDDIINIPDLITNINKPDFRINIY